MNWSRVRLSGGQIAITAALLSLLAVFYVFLNPSRQAPIAPPGQVRAVLRGHAGPVTAVSFSADGLALATGSWDGKVIIWDTTTAQPRHRLDFRPGTKISEDIWPLLFTPGGDTLIASNLDGPIARVLQGKSLPPPAVLKVWDLSASGQPRVLALPDRVHGILVAADGRSRQEFTTTQEGSATIPPSFATCITN